MEAREWAIIIGCALLGYWIVSWLSDRHKKAQEKIRKEQNRADSSQGNTRGEGDSSSTNSSPHSGKPQSQWYEILDVPASSSLAEIKLAYRRKIQQYHPDRLEGMAPELRKLALEKSQEINAAYSEASRLKS